MDTSNLFFVIPLAGGIANDALNVLFYFCLEDNFLCTIQSKQKSYSKLPLDGFPKKTPVQQ